MVIVISAEDWGGLDAIEDVDQAGARMRPPLLGFTSSDQQSVSIYW